MTGGNEMDLIPEEMQFPSDAGLMDVFYQPQEKKKTL